MICKICQNDKEIENFSRRLDSKHRNKIRYRRECKECHKKKTRSYYWKDKKKYIRRNRAKVHELKAFANRVRSYLGCQLCDEKESCCIDFHHKNPLLKTKAISKMCLTTVSIETLKQEMRKCIPVCRNCHAKIHAGLIEV